MSYTEGVRISKLASVVLACCAWACGSDDGGGRASGTVQPNPAAPGQPWQTLAEWQLFADISAQVPAERVVPYDVASPLFSDYAAKRRFMWIPEGTRIGYRDDGRWQFPEGTILIKTFSMLADFRDPDAGERLLETRLLVSEPGGWTAHTYVFDASETAAERKVAGDVLDVSWIDASGEQRSNAYVVPNQNECGECHGKDEALGTIGGQTAQLERTSDYGNGDENQIDHIASLGWFDSAPGDDRFALPDPFGPAPVEQRARSYLDANCAHCHSENGGAAQSGLLLDWDSTDSETQPEANWGVCKLPTSAGGATCGLTHDVVPGNPDASILVCRTESEEAKVRMPPVGTRIAHAEGVQLLREWIGAMPARDCN